MIGLAPALQGLARSEAQFTQSGQSIARAPLPAKETDTVDLSAAAVELLTSRNNFEAITKFIKTSDEMDHTLINTLG